MEIDKIKCEACGCTGIHACLGKPTYKYSPWIVTTDNLKEKFFEKRSLEEYRKYLYGEWLPQKPTLTSKQIQTLERTGELPEGFLEDLEQWEKENT